MQTFKAFLQILRKNIAMVLVYIGIFTSVIFIISANNAEDSEKEYKNSEIPFAVIDRDKGTFGNAIKEYLSAKNEYKEQKDDIDAIRNNLFYRNIYYVLIIPEGYEESLMSGGDIELENMKVKDSAMGYYMDMEVGQFMTALKSYIAVGRSMEEAIDSAMAALEAETEVKMSENSKRASGYKENYYYYNVLPYALLTVIISAVGPAYVAFNRRDVRRRINCSATSFKSKNMQIALGAAVVGGVLWIGFNLISVIVYQGNMSLIEIGLNLLNTLCMVMVSLGIAFLCGNFANSTGILGAMVNVVALGMSFLGGVFVPLVVFGDTMKKIAKFMPTYWYITANDAIVGIETYSDLDKKAAFSGMGMQLMFAAAIFGIALVVIKRLRTRD